MGKKLIIHGADFSGITYANYQFSVSNNSISIAPENSVTIVVTSSRVPTQNGTIGNAQFCPFTASVQGNVSCEFGQVSDLTQSIVVTAANNATGTAAITLTQIGSSTTQTIEVSIVTYNLSVSDPAEYDNGRIAMGCTKTIIVTSYKEVNNTMVFEDFNVSAPSGATVVKGTPSGTTCEVTIGIPYDVAFLGKNNTWTFEQTSGDGVGSIAMRGVPNWVLGYWYNNSFTKNPAQGARFYVSLANPSSSTAGLININNLIDFSVSVSWRNSRFVCGSTREGDSVISPPRNIQSLNTLLNSLNDSGSSWSLNFGDGNPVEFSYVDSADANGFYHPTAAQLEEINNKIVFTQIT